VLQTAVDADQPAFGEDPRCGLARLAEADRVDAAGRAARGLGACRARFEAAETAGFSCEQKR
jgi:hypothetical protein